MEIKEFLQNEFKTEVIENQANQKNWLTWYQNNNPWRNYWITLANEKRSKKKITRMTMNSCKRVCEDWANLLLNEKTDIVSADEKQNNIIQDVFAKNDFWQLANNSVEKNQAIGGGAFVLSKDTDGNIKIEYVDGTRCYILECDNNEVINCAFENKLHIKGEQYTVLSVHIRNVDKISYTIYNYLFDKDMNKLTSNEMLNLIQVDDVIPSEVKTFSFFAPQNVCKRNWDTPFSDSVFSKAIDANKLIDLAFDSYANEFQLGKKRIFVATEMATYAKVTSEENGKAVTVRVPTFDENETVFNLLPEQDDGKALIKEIDMELRVSEHEKGIQNALNYFASLCGLGEKYYTYENGALKTATEVVSENSSLFRNIQKQQVPIERMLIEVCEAILGLSGITEYAELTVEFDDSIIVDREAERQRDMIDVREGIMSKAEYRAKYYGEAIEKAKQAIADINSETANDDLNEFRV